MTPASLLIALHAHPRSFGLGAPGELQDAAGASAFLMVALIAFLSIGILIFALTLRHRSLHPSPESVLLDEIEADQEYRDSPPAGGRSKTSTTPAGQAWEKPDDWWKSPPSHS